MQQMVIIMEPKRNETKLDFASRVALEMSTINPDMSLREVKKLSENYWRDNS